MASIKLEFSANKDTTKEQALYFQITHKRISKRIKTDCSIYGNEWDEVHGDIIRSGPLPESRKEPLRIIRDKIILEKRKIENIIKSFENTGKPYSSDDIIRAYKKSGPDKTTVFGYMRSQSERMAKLGRIRTGETYMQTLRSFIKFRNGVDLYFDMLDVDVVEHYESHLRSNRLCRNTTSFYMRILRCIYNRAVEEGLTMQRNPFKRVYTGVDKTSKRAITIKEIRRIKELDLTDNPGLDYARDIFLLSFYLRGMSFIDLAYLRKRDQSNGYITYIRQKTGQKLTIRWETAMQEILDKYPENTTQYLMPVITKQNVADRQQYLNRIRFVNRKLKNIAQLAKIATPLSMYVARHSWASIAKSHEVPLSIISEAMGHDNEETTRIYLASIQTKQIDEVNFRIIKEV